eukprot:gene15483-11075_t
MSAPPKKEKQQQNNPAGKKGGQNQPKQQQQQQQKPKQTKAQPSEDVKREQKLQAIILADSFSKTFRPVTLECPKVLLPLANVPMLDYTIEFLSQNGVEEIFIFCVWHADQVEEYIRNSRWNDIVTIQCISSSSCSSAGDALREIDGMNVIRSDPFILISGDVVANINLQKAIAYHKKKRQEDSSNIMTLTLRKVQKTTGTKPLSEDLVIGMNKKTSQIVLFDDNISKSKVQIPIPLLKGNELSFTTEYLDCNVDICSPELILQFSDNFDYRDIRRDFIHNEVTNFALGKHIYGYVLENEYAARVQDPRSYHAISRDIVTRWVYPLVPDVQLLQSDTTYVQSKRHVYKEQGVKVSRSANIIEEVVIGRSSVIGDESTVTRSTIGRNVRVGNHVTIRESHIWNNVTIEDNVFISEAIICDGAVIKSGAVIPRGSIISFGVVVEAGTQLKDYTRMTKAKEEVNLIASPALDRSLWTRAPEPVEDGSEDDGYDYGDEDDDWKPQTAATDASGDEDEDDSDHDSPIDRKQATKGPRSPVPQRGSARGQTPQVDKFHEHVVDLVSAAISENQPATATLMEIKGLKFSHNKSFAECVRSTMAGALTQVPSTSVKEAVLKLKSLVAEDETANTLLSSLSQSPQDELEMITAVEDFVLQSNNYSLFGTSLAFFIRSLYDEDLVSEDAVLLWSSNVQKLAAAIENGSLVPSEVDKQRLVMFEHPLMKQFLESVEEDSEEEDDEDDEDEEDD